MENKKEKYCKSSLCRLDWNLCFKFTPVRSEVALCWAAFVLSMSLLFWEPQKWKQEFRCGCTVLRGRITFLNLLASFILRQPLAFFVTKTHSMFSLMGRRTFRSFSAKLLSGYCSVCQCLELFLPRRSTLCFPLLNSVRFVLAHFSVLSKSLWLAACLTDKLAPSPSLMSLANLLSVHSHASSGSLRKSNRTVPSLAPCYSTWLCTANHHCLAPAMRLVLSPSQSACPGSTWTASLCTSRGRQCQRSNWSPTTIHHSPFI